MAQEIIHGIFISTQMHMSTDTYFSSIKPLVTIKNSKKLSTEQTSICNALHGQKSNPGEDIEFDTSMIGHPIHH